MATHNFKMLAWPTLLAASAAAIVTGAASTPKQIHQVLLHNTTTATVSASLYLVPNSSGSVGAAAASNRIFYISLTANDSALLEFPGSLALVLDSANDTLQALASTEGAITISVKGDVIS